MTQFPLEHGGDIQAARRRYGRQKFIDFSANINPLGPPVKVLSLLRQARRYVVAYPEPRSRTLGRILAEKHAVDPNRVIVGNGAAELLYLLARALSVPKAFLYHPTFSEYGQSQRAAGGKTCWASLSPQKEFKLPVVHNFPAGSRLLFFCNPNNPTGKFYPKSEVMPLVEEALQHNMLVLLDYSFAPFLGKRQQAQLLSPQDFSPGRPVFFLFSMTKFYALPGLRLGYGIGPAPLIRSLEKLRDPWSVNALAQEAGEKALQDRLFNSLAVRLLSAWREAFALQLSSLPGVTVYPGAANFLLCQLPGSDQESSALPAVQDFLAHKGFLVRSASNFPTLGRCFIRLAVRLPAENTRLVKVLGDYLSL
jgi:threonine-phosphate decarboxylase